MGLDTHYIGLVFFKGFPITGTHVGSTRGTEREGLGWLVGWLVGWLFVVIFVEG